MKIYHEEELKKIQKNVFIFLTEEESLKAGTKGIAKIRYPEGSVYTGPVEFTGKTFEKLGFGRQDFTKSDIDCDTVGGPEGDTLYLYEGMFNYRKTEWISGDGIFYFLKDGKPDAYFPGYFAGTSYVKEYTGENPEALLLPSFQGTKKLTALYPHRARIHQMLDEAKKKGPTDYLFIGDSFFDFMNGDKAENGESLFAYYTKGKDAFNAGIGGFRFADFLPFLKELIEYINPKTIIINLGFNDIHSGTSVEDTIKNAETFLKTVFSIVPDCQAYLLTLCHFPAFPFFLPQEDEYNQKIFKLENDRIHVIEAHRPFDEIEKRGENFSSYCKEDNIHPNNKGYEIWMEKILREVKGC